MIGFIEEIDQVMFLSTDVMDPAPRTVLTAGLAAAEQLLNSELLQADSIKSHLA